MIHGSWLTAMVNVVFPHRGGLCAVGLGPGAGRSRVEVTAMKLWYVLQLFCADQDAQYVSREWLADRMRWETRQGVDGPRWTWPLRPSEGIRA